MPSDHEVKTTDTGSSISKEAWVIKSSTFPISNAPEIASLQDGLGGLPLPEMPYGNNSLIIKNIEHSWGYSFTTIEALRLVKMGELGPGDGRVQVGYAKEWLQSR